jgi:hypothetical protein
MRTFNFTLLAMLGYVAVVVGAIPLASGNLNRAPAAEAVDRLERYAPLTIAHRGSDRIENISPAHR